MKVNIKDYYPNADYCHYMKGGVIISRPENTTIEVGDLMYDKENNCIGMVLGCIDENQCGELRLDTDGMRSIDSLRPAILRDFDIEGVGHTKSLAKPSMMKTKKLKILTASLINKESILNQRFETHFASVAQANGQPLNDKQNGQSTFNKWERQKEAIRNQKESIEKTRCAIEKEEWKIIDTEGAKEKLPTIILEMLETEQLTQWRKHPNTFFVKGVEKARIVFDPKKRIIFTRYRKSINEQSVWKLFATAFNTILKRLQEDVPR